MALNQRSKRSHHNPYLYPTKEFDHKNTIDSSGLN